MFDPYEGWWWWIDRGVFLLGSLIWGVCVSYCMQWIWDRIFSRGSSSCEEEEEEGLYNNRPRRPSLHPSQSAVLAPKRRKSWVLPVENEARNQPCVLPMRNQYASKGEYETALALRNLLPRITFVKIRPEFLRYEGACLELDFYSHELQLAIEYQGRQHVEFVPDFHPTRMHLLKQQERDQFKRDQCGRLGILLLEVPHTYTTQGAIEIFLTYQFRHHGIL